MAIDHQIQRAIAIHIDQLQIVDFGERYGHDLVANENRPTAPIALARIQKEAHATVALVGEDQIAEPVAVYVGKIGVDIGAGKVMQIFRAPWLDIAQPRHIAILHCAVAPRKAHDAADRRPRPVVVVPAPDQIGSTITGEVHQSPRSAQRDRSRHAGVVAQ